MANTDKKMQYQFAPSKNYPDYLVFYDKDIKNPLSGESEGMEHIVVCGCDEEKDAEQIVKCMNMHDELVDSLGNAMNLIDELLTGRRGSVEAEIKNQCAALAEMLEQAKS